MRKLYLLLVLAVMFGMSSCYHTYYVTKKTTFDNMIDSVRVQLSDQGFAFVGIDRSITDMVPSPNLEKTISIQKETYRFADDSGKTMSYSVSYGKGESPKGVVFVNDVELCECETTDPNDFEKLCGDDAAIVKQVLDIPKDYKTKRLNLNKTIFAICISPIIVLFACIPFALLLDR